MAVDIHLKIEGPDVKGESKVKGCEEQLQLLSASLGLSNNSDPHAGGGAGAGKAHLQDMSCSM
jgi:type VI secretion system secreted protein Hcp